MTYNTQLQKQVTKWTIHEPSLCMLFPTEYSTQHTSNQRLLKTTAVVRGVSGEGGNTTHIHVPLRTTLYLVEHVWHVCRTYSVPCCATYGGEHSLACLENHFQSTQKEAQHNTNINEKGSHRYRFQLVYDATEGYMKGTQKNKWGEHASIWNGAVLPLPKDIKPHIIQWCISYIQYGIRVNLRYLHYTYSSFLWNKYHKFKQQAWTHLIWVRTTQHPTTYVKVPIRQQYRL